MNKVVEEEMSARSNYVTTAGICVGEAFGAKASFWPEVLKTTGETGFEKIWSKADNV